MAPTLTTSPDEPARVPVLAIAIAVAGALLAGITGNRSVGWIGRVFPGFAVLDNRVIQPFSLPNWGIASVPGLYLAEVVRMNGDPVTSGRALYARVEALAEGTVVRYVVRRGSDEQEIALPTQRFGVGDWVCSCGAALLSGLVFVASVVALLALRPRDPATGPLLALFGSIGLTALSIPDTTAPPIFLRLAAVGFALLPATSLYVALAFPAPHRWLRFHGPAYLLAFGLLVGLQAVLYDPPRFARLLIVICCLVGGIQLAWSYRVLRGYWAPDSRLAQQRVKVLTLATALGLGLPAIISAVSAVVGGVAISPTLGAFTAPIIPLSFAYAVVKHDLFEIDALVKRGAYYLVLSGLVAVTYAAAIAGCNWLLQRGAHIEPSLIAVLCALVVLLLLNPVRTRLQQLVRHVLFGAPYDGAESLALAGGELAAALDRREIAAIVERIVHATIPNTGTRMFTLAADPSTLTDVVTGAALPAALVSGLARGRLLTAADAVEAYPDPDEHRATRQALKAVHASLAVPVLQRGTLVGAMTVGPKRFGLYYTAADGAFLQALAHAVAIALQNADSFERLGILNRELERRVRERTHELEAANLELRTAHEELTTTHEHLKETQRQLVHSEKMVSLGRLAAGVAHEINNPMSFITATVEPLQRRLERALREGSPELVRVLEEALELVTIMARGADRTAAIVMDLRAFSHLQEIERKPIDLHAGVEMALRMLEARWQGRITIHRAYAALPAVDGDRGQLNQVFLHLLGNACDAIVATGNIWITTGTDGTSVNVTIQDDGHGIPPEIVPRVFEPFFTTKPVGQGAGLGLAVSHGIVAAHGGRLDVEAIPSGGALFRVNLPVSGASVGRAVVGSRG
jgi:signal transduction histidine kinase